MQVEYKNCHPMDALGDAHTGYRLTFAPQNALFADNFPIEDWGRTAAPTMLERIGQTPYWMVAQGEPTIIDLGTWGGKAAVIDVLPRGRWAGARLESALTAIEDSYAYAKLTGCERLGALTDSLIDTRAGDQYEAGTDAAKENADASLPAQFEKQTGAAFSWTRDVVIGLAVVAVVIAALYFLPKSTASAG